MTRLCTHCGGVNYSAAKAFCYRCRKETGQYHRFRAGQDAYDSSQNSPGTVLRLGDKTRCPKCDKAMRLDKLAAHSRQGCW